MNNFELAKQVIERFLKGNPWFYYIEDHMNKQWVLSSNEFTEYAAEQILVLVGTLKGFGFHPVGWKKDELTYVVSFN